MKCKPRDVLRPTRFGILRSTYEWAASLGKVVMVDRFDAALQRPTRNKPMVDKGNKGPLLGRVVGVRDEAFHVEFQLAVAFDGDRDQLIRNATPM